MKGVHYFQLKTSCTSNTLEVVQLYNLFSIVSSIADRTQQTC